MSKLMDQIDMYQNTFAPESYPISISEIASMYSDGDLVIRPEFQRYFRRDGIQKSRLIESIFLGLPLPSFFVATSSDRKREVVDGLQRLSTIFEFMGVLTEEHVIQIDSKKEISKGLVDSEHYGYLGNLSGMTWDKIGDEEKRTFKRYKLNFNILKIQSKKEAKYELFQRLNTGGKDLSKQEVRNCIMIMENHDFYKYIKSLSIDEGFQGAIKLSDEMKSSQYEMELVLRFLSIRRSKGRIQGITNVDSYIDGMYRGFMSERDESDYRSEQEIFKDTFSKLFRILGNKVFLRHKEGERKGRMIIPFFDLISLWVSNNLDLNDSEILRVIDRMRLNEKFNESIGSGPSAETKLKFIISEGQAILDNQ